MNKPINLILYLYQKIILNSTFLILNYKVNPPVNFVDILPYKGRQTPLTPLHRGGLEGLHKGCLKELNNGCMDETYSKMIKDIYSEGLRYAFSLIELSIVLIIIGLLVAGVTGGKSLIESAKTRALMNEIRNYKQAVNTFYVAHDRFPGDANKDGLTNERDDGSYNFPSPYNKDDQWNFYIQAPWIEMYLDGIIDFKVNPDYIGYSGTRRFEPEEMVSPHSKVFPTFAYDIDGAFTSCYGYLDDDMLAKCRAMNNLVIASEYEGASVRKFNIKLFQNIDNKMDDGKALTGNVFAYCDNDYEDDEEGYCNFLTMPLNFQ